MNEVDKMAVKVTREDITVKIQEVVKELRGDIGIAFKDLTDGEEYHFNSDEWFATASTFKIFILVELFKQIEEGKISLDDRLTITADMQAPGGGVLKDWDPGLNPTVKDLATVMIQISDNTATDLLFEKLGIENINQTMKDLGYDEINVVITAKEILFSLVGLDSEDLTEWSWPSILAEFERRRGNALYNENGKFASDQKNNNVATPRCVNQLVSDLYYGKVLSEDSSSQILNIMKRQLYRNQIHKYLPKSVVVANKPGGVEGVRCDSGIVYGDRPFAITCFSKNLEQFTEGEEAIAKISKIFFDYVSSK